MDLGNFIYLLVFNATGALSVIIVSLQGWHNMIYTIYHHIHLVTQKQLNILCYTASILKLNTSQLNYGYIFKSTLISTEQIKQTLSIYVLQ